MKDAPFDEIVLTRLTFAAQQGLPRYVAEMAEAESIGDMIGDELVFRLRSEVLAQRHDTQKAYGSLVVKLDFPATWWQHLKQRLSDTWWCRWLVARHPVRMTTHTHTEHATFDIERYRAFPEATIVPQLGRETHLLMPGRTFWSHDPEATRDV